MKLGLVTYFLLDSSAEVRHQHCLSLNIAIYTFYGLFREEGVTDEANSHIRMRVVTYFLPLDRISPGDWLVSTKLLFLLAILKSFVLWIIEKSEGECLVDV